ncbi:hypothetical protein H5410_040943 [Solanum commersonii]|uniref:Uncharacterized protein n=1 Tax=Solanum commersonii TaxID=4109 RepID=A0A9J5XRL2_SOLCO|nr:hypothetical protein H5410_040943 [Solanum commersonii]
MERELVSDSSSLPVILRCRTTGWSAVVGRLEAAAGRLLVGRSMVDTTTPEVEVGKWADRGIAWAMVEWPPKLLAITSTSTAITTARGHDHDS